LGGFFVWWGVEVKYAVPRIQGGIMKSLLILCSLLIATSIACAEMYKWEDANGMHFTDNPMSIPEKYRAKALGEAGAADAKPQVGMSPAQQSKTVAESEHLRNMEEANIERNRIAAESIKSQQAALKAQQAIQAARMEQQIIRPLLRFVAFWILIGAFTFIVWLLTLVDILRNEFTNPTNKIVWLLIVLFLAPVGVLLYLIVGRNQKIDRLSAREKEQAELLARLHPKEQKDGDFNIS